MIRPSNEFRRALGKEASFLVAPSETTCTPTGLVSRRRFLTRVLLAIPLVQSSRSLAKEQRPQSKQLVRATLTNPQLWSPEFRVGEALVGQVTATNPDQTSPQDGIVRLILYDAEHKVESSATVPVFVPTKGTLSTVFAVGPKPKTVGAKTLELHSALNSVKVPLTVEAAIQRAPTKADMPPQPPKTEGGCSSIVTTLGLCR
jgi:hypothetical protein